MLRLLNGPSRVTSAPRRLALLGRWPGQADNTRAQPGSLPEERKRMLGRTTPRVINQRSHICVITRRRSCHHAGQSPRRLSGSRSILSESYLTDARDLRRSQCRLTTIRSSCTMFKLRPRSSAQIRSSTIRNRRSAAANPHSVGHRSRGAFSEQTESRRARSAADVCYVITGSPRRWRSFSAA